MNASSNGSSPSRAAKNASSASPPSASSPVPKRRGSRVREVVVAEPEPDARVRRRARRRVDQQRAGHAQVLERKTSSASSQTRYLPRRPSRSTARPSTASATSPAGERPRPALVEHLERAPASAPRRVARGDGGSSRPRAARASPDYGRSSSPIPSSRRSARSTSRRPGGPRSVLVVEDVVELQQPPRAEPVDDRERGRRAGAVGVRLRVAAQPCDRARGRELPEVRAGRRGPAVARHVHRHALDEPRRRAARRERGERGVRELVGDRAAPPFRRPGSRTRCRRRAAAATPRARPRCAAPRSTIAASEIAASVSRPRICAGQRARLGGVGGHDHQVPPPQPAALQPRAHRRVAAPRAPPAASSTGTAPAQARRSAASGAP